MSPVYLVQGGQLVIIDLDSPGVLWQGQPENKPVQAALWLPGSTDGLVLLEWESGERKTFENLLRCRVDGSIVWRARLPDESGGDRYVDMVWSNAGLVAWSWSCYMVLLDSDNGTIIRSTFTK